MSLQCSAPSAPLRRLEASLTRFSRSPFTTRDHIRQWVETIDLRGCPADDLHLRLTPKELHPALRSYAFCADSDRKSRFFEEEKVIAELQRSHSRAVLKTDAFPAWCIAVGRMIGQDGLRTGQCLTETDFAGQCIVYPDSSLIANRLVDIGNFMSHLCSSAFGLLFVMNAIFNVHPFMDGNGRLGRIAFNVHFQAFYNTDRIIPICELNAVTRGGFVIALRDAQYYGRYRNLCTIVSNLLDFLSTKCRLS